MKKQKTIWFTEKQNKMIDDIKKETGMSTETSVVFNALAVYYHKIIPKYLQEKISPLDDEDMVKARAKVKVETENARKEYKLQPKIDICTKILGGKVEDNTCVFMQYGRSKNEDELFTAPLSIMTEEYAENNQYFPNKEVVFKHRKKL